MACCASLFGCYKPTDSVVVVVMSTKDKSEMSPPRASDFPPPHELYGPRALDSEAVDLMVQNTPGNIATRRFRNGVNYSRHQVEVAACSHIVIADQRLLVLFEPMYGGTANLVVRWDHPNAHEIQVEVAEDRRPSDREKTKKKAAAADLLVVRWDHGAILQRPNCSGLVEARLRTPHAKLVRGAILLEQRKEQEGRRRRPPRRSTKRRFGACHPVTRHPRWVRSKSRFVSSGVEMYIQRSRKSYISIHNRILR
jgi:hypothetical protein